MARSFMPSNQHGGESIGQCSLSPVLSEELLDVEEEREDVDVDDGEDVIAKRGYGLSSARSRLEPRQATTSHRVH